MPDQKDRQELMLFGVMALLIVVSYLLAFYMDSRKELPYQQDKARYEAVRDTSQKGSS